MKILLDNCVAYRFKRSFREREVFHCKDMGWEKLGNGRLLSEAAKAAFDVMITVDKKIKHEHNLDHLPLTVLEIDLPDSRLTSITSIIDKIDEALLEIAHYRFLSINENGIVKSVPKT